MKSYNCKKCRFNGILRIVVYCVLAGTFRYKNKIKFWIMRNTYIFNVTKEAKPVVAAGVSVWKTGPITAQLSESRPIRHREE